MIKLLRKKNLANGQGNVNAVLHGGEDHKRMFLTVKPVKQPTVNQPGHHHSHPGQGQHPPVGKLLGPEAGKGLGQNQSRQKHIHRHPGQGLDLEGEITCRRIIMPAARAIKNS